MQMQPLGHHKDLQALLGKLKEYLATRLSQCSQTRRQLGQVQVAKERMEALLVLASHESAFLDVMEFLNKLENGSDKPQGDFLGADLLPPLAETNELMEQ